MNELNVFLDSNILHEDYFFESKFPRKILEYAKIGLIHLYMSEVVRLELRWQFQKEIEFKNKELSRVIKDSSRLKIDIEISLLDVPGQLKKFNDFYSDLEQMVNFVIIQYNNDFLPDIVDRAIYRKKPFSESKTELKDALIWKSYSDFVERQNIDNCIFLTNNTTDFCLKKDKSSIHPDLLRDTERFSVINSTFEFIKQKSNILESPEHKLEIYLQQLDFTDDWILELVLNNFTSIVERRIHQAVEGLSPNGVLKSDFWYDGYVDSFAIDIIECRDAEYEPLTDSALVSGSLLISCESACYQYNSARDQHEEELSLISHQDLIFEMLFNFDIKVNDKCSDFEVTDLEVIGIE